MNSVTAFVVFVATGEQAQYGAADVDIQNKAHGWLSAKLSSQQTDGDDQRYVPR